MRFPSGLAAVLCCFPVLIVGAPVADPVPAAEATARSPALERRATSAVFMVGYMSDPNGVTFTCYGAPCKGNFGSPQDRICVGQLLSNCHITFYIGSNQSGGTAYTRYSSDVGQNCPEVLYENFKSYGVYCS